MKGTDAQLELHHYDGKTLTGAVELRDPHYQRKWDAAVTAARRQLTVVISRDGMIQR